jgi:hypothetical protein
MLYGIHYLVNRESDQSVEKITCNADQLDDAIVRAQSIFLNTLLAHSQHGRSDVVGFTVLDNSGRVLYRWHAEDELRA